MMHSTHWTFKK